MIKNGALKIMRVAGIDIYIHWSWLIILYILGAGMGQVYKSPAFVAIDVGLYILMVTFHEIIQCICGRMVNGTVSEMYISFLGRTSNLELPQRPWPIILTYTGGILAYVMMLGATVPFFFQAHMHSRWTQDTDKLSLYLLGFNVILLAWTAAPVYPLDGGKILQAVLWLFMSRKRSLQVACILGIPSSLIILAFSIYSGLFFFMISAGMILLQCIFGFKQAKMFDVMEKMPRRDDVICPHCRQHPYTFTSIACPCGQTLDPFDTRGLCPSCGSTTALLACPICQQRSLIAAWFGPTGMFEVQGVSGGPADATPPPVVKPPDSQTGAGPETGSSS